MARFTAYFLIKTGKIGNEKIFVYAVERSVRIRIGKTDNKAV